MGWQDRPILTGGVRDFQSVPAKNMPFSCEREAHPSHFSPFSKCAGIVRGLRMILSYAVLELSNHLS